MPSYTECNVVNGSAMNARYCTSTTRSAGMLPSTRAVTERSRASTTSSAHTDATRSMVRSSLNMPLMVVNNDDSEAMARSGSRWVCTKNASGYVSRSAGSAHRCAPDFNTHRSAWWWDCSTWRYRRWNWYVGAMSASFVTHSRYDGTQYWLPKMTLLKSQPVMRTHSCASSAPVGCMAWRPGSAAWLMSARASASAMRGSVS